MIEEYLITHLGSVLEAPVYAVPPREKQEEFYTVELVGGSGSIGIYRPSIAIQAWAPSNAKAARMAKELVEKLNTSILSLTEIYGLSIQGPYRFPDPNTSYSRYQIVVDLVCSTQI